MHEFKLQIVKFILLLVCFLLALPLSVWSQAYEVEEVTNGGSISGSISFEGTPPKPRVITVTKDKELTKDKERKVDVVIVNNGKLVDAVVYLEDAEYGKDWPKLVDGGMVDQKNVSFIPHSRVIHKGTKIPIKNSDPVMHNIHAYELIGRGRRTIFNKGQPQNMTYELEFDVKRSPFVKLECDAHNFMHDYLFVASNPYYSVSGKDGAFSITDIPPGGYTLVVWHPNLGTQKTEIKVEAGKKVTHNFVFKDKGGSK